MRKLKNCELNRISIEEYKQVEKNQVIIVLDNIRSLNNIGSIFRTADAFRVHAIYLYGITACPPHKDIHKTALGATESVDWKYFSTTEELIRELREQSYKIFAIEQADESIRLDAFEFKAGDKIALVFGNEINGVSDGMMELADGCIEIPQFGTKHSLNIAISAGIVIWHLFQTSGGQSS
jgi:23S rRNA (guanosine2251-2'-O)-methyltransferase